MKPALKHSKKEATEGSTTHFLMGKTRPKQTKPKYLSSCDNTDSQDPKSDEELTKDDDAQWLNHIVIHPKHPSDEAQVTIPTYGVNKRTISP